MNNYFLLAISMSAALFANIIKKYSTERFQSKKIMRFFFNSVVTFTCAVCFFVISLTSGLPKISSFTLLTGMLFGFITAVQFFFMLMAYEKGPFSYSSVIVSLSTIIPALSGTLLWGESIVPIQTVGMVLMLLCFLLSVDFSKSDKKTSPIWFLYIFISFIATGFIGVMQKWHQKSVYKAELDGFLIVAFATAFVFSSIGTVVSFFKAKSQTECNNAKKDITLLAIVLMMCCGICVAANNKMNLYLSGVMDSATFFPVVNGGGMMLSTIASLIIFKEKLTVQKWIGIAIGIVAVILICNPF